MIYSEELKQKKTELQEELQYDMNMLEMCKKEIKRYELIVESLQNQIDGIDNELRGEENK